MADHYKDDQTDAYVDDGTFSHSHSGCSSDADDGGEENIFDNAASSHCHQQLSGKDTDQDDSDVEDGTSDVEPSEGVDPTSALSFGEAILNDIKTTHMAREQQQHGGNGKGTQEKATECCVCGTRAIYTCPGCGRRTCSMTCVRVHKTDFSCSGERDVAAKIPLSEFSDQQLQRDFHFLEDCRRVVDNVERCFPRSAWRFTFKALPPPLHALREAARRRGVICQITSEGMRKRDVNTSRLDRKTNTIVWRCEFQFVDAQHPEKTVTIATDWGSERHRLGDALRYCWATNPSLLCYHINRQYNRASKYVGSTTEKSEASPTAESAAAEAGDGAEQRTEGAEPPASSATETNCGNDADAAVSPPNAAATPAVEGSAAPMEAEERADDKDEAVVEVAREPTPEPVALFAYEEAPAMPPIEPVSPEEAAQQAFVESFLQRERYVILSKAERLGTEAKYFQLSPYETLNESMRRLFFVNEFPVFLVVHASDLHLYPLVTEEDKEMIRSSFRSRKSHEPREKPPVRKRSDMEPEEQERLAKVPCRRFLNGRCQLGEECPYWHCTPEEIPVCRSFLRTGQCDKGVRCSFRHDPEAVRIARKRQREEFGRGGGGVGRGGGGRGDFRGGFRGRGGGRGGFRGSRGPHRRVE